MKKLVTTLFTVAALAVVANAAFAANAVRISQVYGGGGGSSTSATYNQDYVEIFNSSAVAVDISNWAVEYGSATGLWGSSSSNYFVFPAGTLIQPCSYILVTCGTVGTGSPTNPVVGDFNGGMNISSTTGKVGLFSAVNASIACGSEIAGTLVDKVSFGTGNCPEGTNAGAISVSTGAVRGLGGMTDTDNNLADFGIVSNPVAHNSGSARNPDCLATPSMKGTWGALKSIYH